MEEMIFEFDTADDAAMFCEEFIGECARSYRCVEVLTADTARTTMLAKQYNGREQ